LIEAATINIDKVFGSIPNPSTVRQQLGFPFSLFGAVKRAFVIASLHGMGDW
jgi:hypothetical protein